jgi:hypothetical protein
MSVGLPSGNVNAPLIERRYLSQADACTEAIKTLLRKRGRLLDKSGPDDPERRSDEIRAKSTIP